MSIWSGNAAHIDVFNSIAEEYIAENPDSVGSVTFETLSGSYFTTLTTQIAGGDTPDLAWITESSAKEFVESGVLVDLAPAFTGNEGYDFDDVLPNALERWTGSDGGVYGYPFSNSPFGIYVNRDLVEAAGTEQPADLVAAGEWTWDTAVDIAAAVSDTGAGPIVWSAPPEQVWDNLSAIWTGFGANAWSDDGTTCKFDTPEMNDALSWYQDAVFERGGFAEPGQTFSFPTGGAAMMVGQLSNSGSIDDSFEWDFLPLPSGPNGHVDLVGQAGIGVIAKGDSPEVAADFLAFFTNKQNSAKLAQFFPPPRTSLLTVEALQDSAPKLSAEEIEISLIAPAQNAVLKDSSVRYSQISPMLQANFDTVLQRGGDVAAATKAMCEAIDPIIGG